MQVNVQDIDVEECEEEMFLHLYKEHVHLQVGRLVFHTQELSLLNTKWIVHDIQDSFYL